MKIPGNMQSMMKQAQQMQDRLQAEVEKIRVEASSGGGVVTVKMDGHKNVLGVIIDPEAAGDVEMLQDMVAAAFRSRLVQFEVQIVGQSTDLPEQQLSHDALSVS